MHIHKCLKSRLGQVANARNNATNTIGNDKACHGMSSTSMHSIRREHTEYKHNLIPEGGSGEIGH